MHMRLRAAGFTLGELLVVIAIIGVLVALLLPAVQSAREAARRVQCANNLRQIAIALQNYDANFKVLPYGSGYPGATKAAPSWLAMLLPYVERQGHYDLFNFDLDLDDPANQAAMTTPVKSFMCPSDGSSPSGVLPARCTCCNLGHPYTQTGLWYPGSMGPVHRDNCALCSDPNPSDGNFCCQGNSWGNNGAGPGMFFRFPRGIRLAEVTDGTSNTIIVGESIPSQSMHLAAFTRNMPLAANNVPINTMPTPAQLLQDGMSDGTLHGLDSTHTFISFRSRHPGGAQFALCDGSVRMLPQTIDYRLYCNLGTRAGGEAVAVP